MSEDRTQPPSKRRRQLARQSGQAAHSPELTAAAGWVSAVAALVFVGDKLALELTKLVTRSLTDTAVMTSDPAAVVTQVRLLIIGLGWPLASIFLSFAAGALAVHQFQVRGLCATELLIPDLSRLWTPSSGQSLSARAERIGWSMAKAIVLLVAAAWTIRAGWGEVLRLGALEGPALTRGAGEIVLRLSCVLAAVLVVVGLVDFGLRYRRFEMMLRTTTEEQREDRRVVEGDPATRAQRRRIAREFRAHSPELLTGASLILTGVGGLTLVLGGGPPPRRVTIRTTVKGHVGLRLRRLADGSQIPRLDAPDLARRLARRPASQSTLAAELIAELAAHWPDDNGTVQPEL